MGFMKEINPQVMTHLELLAGRRESDASSYLKDLVKAWQKKEKTFMKQVKSFHMTIESRISREEERAFILLTYSGSILGVGPADAKGKREIIYASVGVRHEVPEKLIEEGIQLMKEITLDREAEFSGGALKKSSPVYKIALMADQAGPGQERLIEDATHIMTKEFISINNTIVPE